jgi:hypothetical protein
VDEESVSSLEISAMICTRAGGRFIQSRLITLFGEPIDITCYLEVNLNKRLTWSPHIDYVSKRSAQRMGLLGPLLNRMSELSVRNGILLYKQLIRRMMDYACPAGGPLPAFTSEGCGCYNPNVFVLFLLPLCTLLTGKFTRIWLFYYSQTTSET